MGTRLSRDTASQLLNHACHKNKTIKPLLCFLDSDSDLYFSESFVKERVVNFDKQIHLCGSRSFGCFSITRGRRQGGVVRKSRMDANSRNDTQNRFIFYCWKSTFFLPVLCKCLFNLFVHKNNKCKRKTRQSKLGGF